MLDPVQLLEYKTGLFKDGKMARFGFCAASSLIWGGGWGFAVPFYSIQDCRCSASFTLVPKFEPFLFSFLVVDGDQLSAASHLINQIPGTFETEGP